MPLSRNVVTIVSSIEKDGPMVDVRGITSRGEGNMRNLDTCFRLFVQSVGCVHGKTGGHLQLTSKPMVS